ncbi:DUF3653 domain-containing protein [Luteibacter jiangsuensis]|uniref:DUF3653 domain-containing protein n=1 Tax=Luteibacter jiangsuensis TaxID=637577 RepID=UPI003D2F8856
MPEWSGWIIKRGKIFSPDGRGWSQADLGRWWLILDQARLFRDRYDAETWGVGRSPAKTLQPEAEGRERRVDAACRDRLDVRWRRGAPRGLSSFQQVERALREAALHVAFRGSHERSADLSEPSQDAVSSASPDDHRGRKAPRDGYRP